MEALPPNLARFIGGVHRRLTALRLLESAGVGLVVAAALALLVLPVLFYRNQDPLTPCLVLLSLGAVVGLAAALLRLPRVMDAAREADHQLDLADLLSSAVLVAGTSSDAFASAVLASADARCRSLPPSTVILNRLGARAWSGIGLSASLVLALSLLSGNPADSRAAGDAGAAPQAAANSRAIKGPGQASSATAGGRPSPITRDQPHDDRNIDDSATARAGVADDGQKPAGAQPRDGAGPGSARSAASDLIDPAHLSGTAAGASPDGEKAAGAGAASPGAGSDASAAAAGVSGGARPAVRPAPLWTTPGWTDAQRRADEAIRSSAVPPEYYDLMRAYFDRH